MTLGIVALSLKCQSTQMSEIKNVGYIWMALNTFKCNCLTPLQLKGLSQLQQPFQ